jgi:hypothetical protein
MRDGLGDFGKQIWDAYGADGLDPGSRAIVLAYARAADVADRLDGLASARQDSWATLVFDDMGEIHLQIDKILDQHRAQLLALKQLHGELRQAGIKATAPTNPTARDEEPEDMLARRRKEREQRERQLG